MLVVTLIIALTLVFFTLISRVRSRIALIQDEIFKSSYSDLRKAQLKISFRELPSTNAKRKLDRYANQLLYHTAQIAYGDEGAIPMQQYAAFRKETNTLKSTFNQRIRSFKKS